MSGPNGAGGQKIVTNLWFHSDPTEAIEFYIATLGEGRILATLAATGSEPGATAGAPLTVEFELFGQRFVAINGGPMFTFNEAISLQVNCEDQAEIDRVWSAFLDGGGTESMCGWLKDRWGLSWQIVPRRMHELFAGDPAAAKRVMDAMLTMRKLDVAALEAARLAA